MSDHRQAPPDNEPKPAASADRLAPPVAGPLATTNPRHQPPLQEVSKGLDARELEGQTVFDQLFGPLPEAKPRPR